MYVGKELFLKALVNVNLQFVLNKFLLSLELPSVSIIYESSTAHIASSVLASNEFRHIVLETIRIDHFYTPREFYGEPSIMEHTNFVITILKDEYEWAYRDYQFQRRLSSFLIILENDKMNNSKILGFIKFLHSKGIYFVAILRIYDNESVQVCVKSRNGQLLRFNQEDFASSSASAYDLVYRSQFVDLHGASIRVFVRSFSQEFYKSQARNIDYGLTEFKQTVSGTYVYLGAMIGRYLNANITFVTLNSDQIFDVEEDFVEYMAAEMEKIYPSDEVVSYILSHQFEIIFILSIHKNR